MMTSAAQLPFPDDVAVAIVAHNSRERLVTALDSLQAAGCPAARIMVVDVASTDGTGDWLAREWPEIRQHRLDRNDGPSPGRNVGIREAPLPYVFLMDADVVLRPDTVQRLREAMRAHPRAKVGSPIVVHQSRPDVIQYAGGSLHYICEAVNPWLDRPLADHPHQLADIGAAPTCGLLLDRQAAIEVGLFDERYFIGKEDGDFSHRIKLAGYEILEVPDSVLLHYSRPRGTWLFYYQIRNRWHFMLKNYQVRTLLAILPALLVHEPLQFAMLVVKGHGKTYFRAVGGLIAMLPALPADRALTRRIRVRQDAELLCADPLVIRDDLAGNVLIRWGKQSYERALAAYWWLLTHTVLPR
ncbi:MAG: glycosyltransferase family 2 protein [Acidobacteriota bacterium]|nr:glycosyltransferase family 2 protein [Acidobacteriota bacterium]